MTAYRLTPAAVTAIWRRTGLCGQERIAGSSLGSRGSSGTCRSAPPTAGHAASCSAQTECAGWLVTASQPHASHATSIKRAPWTQGSPDERR
jgi:hypothetical protein